jgi:hypothetical protein
MLEHFRALISSQLPVVHDTFAHRVRTSLLPRLSPNRALSESCHLLQQMGLMCNHR